MMRLTIVFFILSFLFQKSQAQNYTDFSPKDHKPGAAPMIGQLPDGRLIGVTKQTTVNLFSATGAGLNNFIFSTGTEFYPSKIFVEDDGILIVNTTNQNGAYAHGWHAPTPVSSSNDIWMMKIDFNLDTLWTKCIGSHRPDAMNKIIQSKDGGYIMFATVGDGGGDVTVVDSLNHPNNIYWMCKLDSAANIEWEYAPNEQSFGSIRQGLAESANGDIYIYMQGTFNIPFFLKVDKDGNELLRIDTTNYQTKLDVVKEMYLTNDHRLVIFGMGFQENSYAYPVIEVYDTNGMFIEELWMTEIGVNSNLVDVIIKEDEALLLIRARDNPGTSSLLNDIVFAKVDINDLSKWLWVDRIYGEGDDLPYSFVLKQDGGLVIAANSNSKELHYLDVAVMPLEHLIVMDSCDVEAGFSYMVSDNTVSFADASINAAIVEYLLDTLGNTTNANPTYTFPSAGDYEVCQIAVAQNFCEATFCDTITTTGTSTNIEQHTPTDWQIQVIDKDLYIDSRIKLKKVTIYTLLGQKVIETNAHEVSLKQCSGTYLCKLEDINGIVSTHKIMIY